MSSLAVVFIAVIALLGFVWLTQERLIFFPQPVQSTKHLPASAKPLEVVAADGARLRGWIVGAATARSRAPVVIYFGGNAEEVSWTLADRRWPADWMIAAVNYRGYGGSEGKPGERDLLADALAVYDALTRRDDIDPNRVVAFGRSLGTALAARVAASRNVAGVVLVSPYDSLVAVGRSHYPWLPVSLLLKHRFDALADARRSTAPLLAIVAEADGVIPVERSRALFDGWAGPKIWLSVRDADHNDVGIADVYWHGIERFLAER